MSNFKSLPLDQESIDLHVNQFVENDEYRVENNSVSTSGSGNITHRYLIGKALVAPATVDFICNKDGTTTIHFKLGKNQDLGLKLAEFVKKTINPNEFESVEMTLQHVSTQDIEPLLKALEGDSYEDETKMFEFSIEKDESKLLQIRVKSLRHSDCLVLKHYRHANSFQIQGKPLFVYKRLCYHFVDILDILGIEKVLNRQDESRAQIVSQDVAEHLLRLQIPEAFERLPDDLKKLILSGMRITLASPSLPDYSLLLYPDLRALEGVMYDCFKAYGLYSSNFTDNGEQRVGVMFRKLSNSTYTLKNEHCNTIGNSKMVAALDTAYNQYSGKRNPLFHINEELVFNTFISDLGVALKIIDDLRLCINKLYTHKP